MINKDDRRLYKEKIREIARTVEQPDFNKKIEKELSKIPTEITEQMIAGRRDFRKIFTCTIDPETAQDFDDALSVEILKNGNMEIGVHIADVSYYVKQNTELDREAFKRGTSIYLAQSVIPMLPEKISNDLCSLRQDVDRLTFSVVFTFNSKNTLIETWYGKGVIHSKKRFTYKEAQTILDKKNGTFYKELNILNIIAKDLYKKRLLGGALILEDTELSFTYNKEGHPIDVHPKIRLETHKLVEEFMLLANQKVAELFKKNDTPFVYRIHDKPDKEKLLEVALRAKEYKLDFPKKIKKDLINNFIESIQIPFEKSMFSRMIMRSMAKAIYSSKNIGHFGLGFSNYTHFTSPIRRYPDLEAHRLLELHLLNKKPKIIQSAFEKDLSYLSERERYAQDIERASIKDMQILYMQDRIGETREGFVSGVTQYGIYISDTESNSEGMIHVKNLSKLWIYNEKAKFWKNNQTKEKIKLGSLLNFTVLKVNFDKGTIDYILCDKK